MNKLLITTAIDYTNDVVHLGHSYQKVVADAVARYYRQKLGKDSVYFVTGTDEHGGNIQKAAETAGKDPKAFVDDIAQQDKDQWKALNLQYDRFIRTTDEDHERVVQDFWKRCQKNGDIYKGTFSGLYCFGCEAFKTSSEIVDGKCTLHPTKELQEVSEENYFFAWSKYQKFLEELFQKNPQFVLPQSRYNEMREFLRGGVTDITISRSKEKVGWGIPVPGDLAQVIYVWFDGLIAYFTAGQQKGFWETNTQIIHTMGKDNTRWHALLWPAMLQSAGYLLPDTIYAHGFINLDGRKISKSLGNVIRPSELVDQFGTDAVRYYLLRYGPTDDDVDLSLEKLKAVHNADLANDWGNLVQRVATLCTGMSDISRQISAKDQHFTEVVSQSIEKFEIPRALEDIFSRISQVNTFINQQEPWNKEGEEKAQILSHVVEQICQLAFELSPFLPDSSARILEIFSAEKIVAPTKPLFPRIT